MFEHQGVLGVAGDVHAVKCAHLVLEHEESEGRGVTGVAGDQFDQLVGDRVYEPSGLTS